MRRGPAALLLALAGCAPVVTHGARVHPGPYAGFTAGLLLAPESAGVPSAVTPDLGIYGRYGWAAMPGGAGGSLALSLGTAGVGADAYLQGPWRDSTWAYGAGVTGARGVVMPYLQAGRVLGRGYEVYTTQGYVSHSRFTEKYVGVLDDRTVQARPRYWAPTLAARTRAGALAASLQLTGAFGHYEERPDPGSASGVRRPLRAVAFSVAGEADLVRLLRQGVPPPQRLSPRGRRR